MVHFQILWLQSGSANRRGIGQLAEHLPVTQKVCIVQTSPGATKRKDTVSMFVCPEWDIANIAKAGLDGTCSILCYMYAVLAVHAVGTEKTMCEDHREDHLDVS